MSSIQSVMLWIIGALCAPLAFLLFRVWRRKDKPASPKTFNLKPIEPASAYVELEKRPVQKLTGPIFIGAPLFQFVGSLAGWGAWSFWMPILVFVACLSTIGIYAPAKVAKEGKRKTSFNGTIIMGILLSYLYGLSLLMPENNAVKGVQAIVIDVAALTVTILAMQAGQKRRYPQHFS